MSLKKLEKKMAEIEKLQAETENAHVKLKAQMAEIEKLQAETENAHAKLIAQMAELKERGEEKPKPPHPRWRPILNENYYYIHEEEVCEFNWNDDGHDTGNYSVGNVFATKEAAKSAIERMKVLAEMREWAGNWDDNIVLTYKGNEDVVCISHMLLCNTFGEIRFKTDEDAKNCIKAVGEDRIKKYYFMIPEEETKNG